MTEETPFDFEKSDREAATLRTVADEIGGAIDATLAGLVERVRPVLEDTNRYLAKGSVGLLLEILQAATRLERLIDKTDGVPF